MEEWELSKENVLPLKQGRKAANLSAALQPSNTDKNQVIMSERQAFETELRTNNGEDPLDTWYRYFKWTLQNFPQGGKGSNLSMLLERFFQFYQSQTKYHNDQRLVEIFLQTAAMSNESLECYQFMRDQGIGTQCSQVYENWAWEMEQLGNTKKADLIYQEGLKNNAQPMERLIRMHKEFQSRVSRAACQQIMQTEPSSSQQEQRTTLGDLRGRGKHNQVTNQRIGGAKAKPLQGSRGLLATRPLQPTQLSNKPVEIFCDDANDGGSSLPGSQRQWTTMPTNEDLRKENMSKPSQWNKQSLPQRGGAAASTMPAKATFAIHEDHDSHQSTPHRPLEINSQVLSDRKPESTFRTLPFVPEEPKPNTNVMYCKHLVYAGTTEMSFEELRAIKYRQKKEVQRMEMERKALAADRAQLNWQFEEMQRQREEFMVEQRRQTDIILKQHQEMLMQVQRDMHHQPPPPEERQISNGRDVYHQPPPPEESEERRTSNGSEGNVCTQRLMFDVTETNSIPNLPAVSGNSGGLKSSSFHSAGGNATPNISLNASSASHTKTPQETGLSDSSQSWFLSKMGSGRTPKGLAQPSPTINTKEALDVIMGALNSSLGDMQLGNKLFNVEEEPVAEIAATMFNFSHHEAGSAFCPVAQAPSKDPSTSNPFGGLGGQGWDGKIYVDPNEEESTECNKDEEECKENLPPDDYQQFKEDRVLIGVLQPSEGLPCDPDSAPGQEVNEEEDDDELIEQERLPPGAIPKTKSGDFTIFQTTTTSFSTASNMASTPFHASKSLHFPPMSVIKSNATHDEERFAKEATEGGEQILMETDGASGPQRSKVKLQQEESLEVTEYPQVADETKILSPIIEISNEDARSSTSSSPSSVILSQQRVSRTSTLPSITESSFHKGKVEDLSNVTVRRGSRHSSLEDEMEAAAASTVDMKGPPQLTEPSDHGPKSLADELMEVQAGVANVSLMEDEDGQCSEDETADVSMEGTPSAGVDVINPFSNELKLHVLSQLDKPLASYDNFIQLTDDKPIISNVGISVKIGKEKVVYYIKNLCGQGAYAKIYTGCPMMVRSMASEKALKVQKPPCPWEFYISRVMHERMTNLGVGRHVLDSLMYADAFQLCPEESCLVMDHHSHGTLLQLVNRYQSNGQKMPESMVAMLTISILEVIEALHTCKIIHADIKPDNFMLQNVTEGSADSCLKLIDFGQSIDMSLLPDGTTFTECCNTSGFTCVEMKEGRPWTYQTDYFGVAGSIHCMLFSTYMNVYKESDIWKTTAHFKRSYKCGWKGIFHKLLNVASCEPTDLLDLRKIRDQLAAERDQKYTLEKMKTELNMELFD